MKGILVSNPASGDGKTTLAGALSLLILVLGASAFATRNVRDELGRDVNLPDHAHRLVCLAPSITDTVYTDDRIEYPSPVALDAVEDLAKKLHP